MLIKNKNLFLLPIALLFMSFRTAFGQAVPRETDSKVNLAILDIIDEYERVSSFSDSYDRQRFLNLFVSPENACVYNDMFFLSDYQKLISPVSYVNNIPNDGSVFVKTYLYNVVKSGDSFYNNGEIHKKIKFSKYLLVIDASRYTGEAGGIFFDSSQLYQKSPDFNFEAEFVYYQDMGICKIVSLNTTEAKPKSPLDDTKFDVLVKSEDIPYQEHLVCNGEPIAFDSNGQGIAAHNGVDVDSRNLVLTTKTLATGDTYDVKSISIKPLKFRLKIKGAFTPSSAYKVVSTYQELRSESTGMEFGADVGFETSPVSKFRFGLFTGIGVSSSKITLSVENIRYNLDFAGTVGARSYDFSAVETVSMMDFFVPLYMAFEIDLAKRLMLDIDLGGKFYINSQTKLGDYHVRGIVGGTNVDKDYSAFIAPANYSRTPLNVSAFGDIELDFLLVGKFLYAYVLAGYEYGIKPSYVNGSNNYFNPDHNVFPFVYSNHFKDDVAYRSLISSSEFQRRAFLLSIGLKLKF